MHERSCSLLLALLGLLLVLAAWDAVPAAATEQESRSVCSRAMVDHLESAGTQCVP